MADEPIHGTPPKPGDKVLWDAYHQERVRAADRYDELAKELLKIELAIPGIYAAALRLVLDPRSVLSCWSILLIAAAFVLWLAALGLTAWALFPGKYEVLEGVIRRTDGAQRSNGKWTIEEYFEKLPNWKRWRLVGSIFAFFAGTAAAAVAVFV